MERLCLQSLPWPLPVIEDLRSDWFTRTNKGVGSDNCKGQRHYLLVKLDLCQDPATTWYPIVLLGHSVYHLRAWPVPSRSLMVVCLHSTCITALVDREPLSPTIPATAASVSIRPSQKWEYGML